MIELGKYGNLGLVASGSRPMERYTAAERLGRVQG